MTTTQKSFASTDGWLSGGYENGYARAGLTNANSDARYCELFILAGNSVNTVQTIKYSNGRISAGNAMTITKSTSAKRIKAKGVIYKGGNPNAGTGWSSAYWIR